jgi:hypothetical protein
MSLHQMQNLMVVIFGEDGNHWLLEANDWQQYYNNDEKHRLLAILFFGTNGQMLSYFWKKLLKDLSTNYCHIKNFVYVSPWFKLKMAPNNFEVKHHTQIGAQSLDIT